MRKRFANRRGSNYKQIEINEPYFKGYVCYVNFDKVTEPKYVYNGFYDMCIYDTGYEWIMLYPSNGNFSITIIYDNNSNLVEWYFDVASSVGLVNNIPYQEDLYLDMVILPNKSVTVLDEDELISAYEEGNITKNDLDSAYKTLEYLKSKFANNIDKLINFTNHIYDIIKVGDVDGS